MVLNRADLGWCLEFFQTFWNVSYVRANGFPTTFGIVPEDLGWFPKGPKSTDFDQKPCAIAYGFEQGRFGFVLGTVPNFLKYLLCACKWISNYFRDCSWRFGVNSEGSEIHRFWPKPLGAHGFEQGRFRQVLGIVPNSLKCPLLACKCICKCFRDCSWRFGVNCEGSEIHRFWPKTLCYSLWFWTGPIWVGAWNCSQLSEMSPMCVQRDFQLLSGLFLKIWSEFWRVRNPPILTKNPGL